MIVTKWPMGTRSILWMLLCLALTALIYYGFCSIHIRKLLLHDLTPSVEALPSQLSIVPSPLPIVPSPPPIVSLPPPIVPSPPPIEFQKASSDKEMLVFMDLLATLDRVTALHNITFFINYGTLLGSFRHHAIIPWDDDVDVAMPYSKQNLIWSVLSSLASPSTKQSSGGGYMVKYTADTQLRFVHGQNSRIYSRLWPWRWPYIDIDLYFEDSSHIWFHNSNAVYRYHRNIVFPLHRRPLGTLSLNAPRDSYQCLVNTYGRSINVCSNGMHHRVGRERNVTTRPCETLAAFHPFVHRSVTGDGVVLETLRVGNKSLYCVPIDEPPSSATVDPFTLKMTKQ